MSAAWAAVLLLAAQARVPVPSAQEQASAEKELHRLWKADYALLPAQREAVAKKFLARGKEVVEIPFKYVIFRDARDLAVQAGDVATAFGAVDALSAAFVSDGVGEKASILARLEGLARSPEESRAAVATALDLVEEAISLDRPDVAVGVLGRAAARSAKDPELAERSRALAKRLNRALEIRASVDAAKGSGVRDWAAPWMYVNPWDLGKNTYNRRDNAWCSSPKTPDKPFTWVRTVQLTKAVHTLTVDVSAHEEKAVVSSWTLVVRANGDELLRKLVTGAKWQSLEIDLGAYSNKTVTLEVANLQGEGTVSHRAYWSNLNLLPPPLVEVVPIENDPRRASVPDAAVQAKMEKRIQETLPGGLKGVATPAEKAEFARKLVEEARIQPADLPYQYVLLRKARDLGVQAADLKVISESLDLMAGSFGFDAFEEKLASFTKVDAARKTTEGVDWHLQVATDALAAGKCEAALHAVARADRAAKTLKYADGSTRAKDLRTRSLESLSRGWAAQWIWQDTAPGMIVQDTFNARPFTWQCQPAANDRPFKWKRRVRLPAAQPCWLHFDVSSRLPDASHGWEWNAIAVVNGKEVLNKVVKGVEWRHYSVDLSAYAGREVELELWNRSDDAHGHGQTGYWDRVHLAYEP